MCLCLLHRQVSHAFHDAIQKSPWINHRINLYAVGLEDNPESNLILADKRRALKEYRAKWNNLDPFQKWEPGAGSVGCQWTSVLGVYGVTAHSQEFIEFFTLESVSQGVPRKEWKIPLPHFNFSGFAINPHSNLLVVVEGKLGWVLRCWAALSSLTIVLQRVCVAPMEHYNRRAPFKGSKPNHQLHAKTCIHGSHNSSFHIHHRFQSCCSGGPCQSENRCLGLEDRRYYTRKCILWVCGGL